MIFRSMLPKKLRLSARDFPAKAEKFFSGRFLEAKRFRNRLGHNRYTVVVSAGRIKKATRRHLLKRRLLTRAMKFPSTSSDILFIALAEPELKSALDAEMVKLERSL